jgi:hypothetical protein
MKTSWYAKVLPAMGLVLALLACTATPAAADAVLSQLGADLAAIPLDDEALDDQRAAGISGFLAGFLHNLLAPLPPGNLVVAHINGMTIQQGPSPLPVEINASVGGTTVKVFASSGVSASYVVSRPW